MRKPGPFSQSLIHVKCSSNGTKSSSATPDVVPSDDVASPELSFDEVSSDVPTSLESTPDELVAELLPAAVDVVSDELLEVA